MKNFLKHNRQLIANELQSSAFLQYFSPATYGAYKTVKPCIEKYIKGKFIDIGCGHKPYKDLIESKVELYDTFDVEERAGSVTYKGDIQNMNMVKDSSYDTSLCLEVLEHVPDPKKALSEISRILKKDGYLVFSVPHLSRLHEEPHDYYRYTKYGLQYLLNESGFKLINLETRGGLFSFLGHQWASFLVCFFWRVPLLKHIIFFLNKWLCTKLCFFIDQRVMGSDMFALGYTGVAQKI